MRKKLGEILLERGIIDHDQLNAALAYQRQWGHRLGVALVAKGFITEDTLVQVLGDVLGMQVVDLSQVRFEPAVLQLLPSQICESNDLIPIGIEPGRGKGKGILLVAMAEPMNLSVIDEIEFTTNCRVRPFLATISGISSSIRKNYKGQDTSIKPIGAPQKQKTETGKMVLVRPGGETELVDTATRDPTNVGAVTPASPAPLEPIAEQVNRIKARRARRVAAVQGADAASPVLTSEEVLKQYLTEVQNRELETLARLEKYFWALMRVMAKKGLVTKEEFLREMNK
jgi:hypothetical protein